MMAQSTTRKQEDFASNDSYVYIESFGNYSRISSAFAVGEPFEIFRSQLSNGHEECRLTLMLYAAGIDDENHSHVSLRAGVDKNVPYKIIVDVAICDVANKECFKRRIMLTKEYPDKGIITDFVKKSDLRKNSAFLRNNDELKIVCRVVIVDEESQERKLVPDASLLRNVHFDNYEKLFDNEEHSDFALKVGHTTFKVHKCILATHSSVFAAMFRHDMTEKNRASTDIPDVDVEVMREFLRFVYTGKVEKLDELAANLWVIADKYDVNVLKEMSEKELIEKLNVDTIAETLCLLNQFKISNLKDAAINYIINNAEEVKNDKKFKDTIRKLSSDLLADVLYATLGNSKMSS